MYVLVVLFCSIKSRRILGCPLCKKVQIYNRGTPWAVLIYAGRERDHLDHLERKNKCFMSKIKGEKIELEDILEQFWSYR